MQGVGWTKVISKRSDFRWDVFPFGGRNRSSGSSHVTSFYVSEFPEYFNAKRLFELFGCSGNVVEVAISHRRNRYGKRFAFARFSEVEDGRLLAIRLDNILIEGKKIHVNLPRFSRDQGMVFGRKGSSTSKGFVERIHPVSGESTGNVSGAFRGLCCSYAEAVGLKGQVSVAKKEEFAVLNFQSNQALKSRFDKAYVGRVCIPGLAYNIQNYLEMEGVCTIKETPLGGNCFLLEEKEEGFIGDLIKEGESWWKSWFSAIEKWEAGMVDGRRDAWFRIYGIPIHVWTSEFFVLLGEKWGRFICIDDNTAKGEAFDVAIILVNIPISLSIPDCVPVSIDGVIFNLCIREDSQSLYRHVDGYQKVLSSEGDTSDSDFERLMLESNSVCSGDFVGLEDREVLNPNCTDQKAEVLSDKSRKCHSGVVSEVGTRSRNDGPSGVEPEGNFRLSKCFDIRSGSDVVRAEDAINSKEHADPEACAEYLMASRSRNDTPSIRQMDLESGNGDAPSGNCVHVCFEDSSESVSCLKPVITSRLGPVASKALLYSNYDNGIWDDGRSGLDPDGSNPIFRPLVSSPSSDHSKATSVKGGSSAVNTFKSSKLSLHSGPTLGLEGETERCFTSDSGSACVGTVMLNSKVDFDFYPKQCAGTSNGDRGGGKKLEKLF